MTLHTDQAVVRYDPASRAITPVATLDTPVAGLTLGASGTLYVSGGRPGVQGGVIWAVGRDGAARRAADLPDAMFLNGMTAHPDGRRLLVNDSILGLVLAVDPATGRAETWLAHDLLKPTPGDMTPGVNGIKLFGGFAWLSVTATDRLVRAALRPDGAAGPVELVEERLRADDFAMGADGALFIATHPADSLLRLGPDGSRVTLAGRRDGLLSPTAVAFGRGARDRRSVYVTTTGGTMRLPPDEQETAKLVRIDVGAEGAPPPLLSAG